MEFAAKFNRGDVLKASGMTDATFRNWSAGGYTSPFTAKQFSGKWRRYTFPELIRLCAMRTVMDTLSVRPLVAHGIGLAAEWCVSNEQFIERQGQGFYLLSDGKICFAHHEGENFSISGKGGPSIVVPLTPIVETALERLGIELDDVR